MIQMRINQLIQYGLDNQLLNLDDSFYATNKLLDIFKIKDFSSKSVESIDYNVLMNDLIAYALEKSIIEKDTLFERDAFEARLIDCLLPRPSELNRMFRLKYKKSPQQATFFYHEFSKNSRFIKLDRIDQNIKYNYPGKYGDLDITLNLSRPEKASIDFTNLSIEEDQYPLCPLCMENIGMYQNALMEPRMNHRPISITVNNEKDQWAMFYSPYAYFNEHLVVFRKEHIKMYMNDQAFEEMVDFVNKFPHYFIGLNSGLPIVGGSILSHHHFQAGRYDFPIEKARVVKKYKVNRVSIEVLDWPVATIRLIGNNENRLLDTVHYIYENWKKYHNESLKIFSETSQVHQSITPFVKLDGLKFNFYMVFRNNFTNDDLPHGLFHPSPEKFHIKKENIGLFEVMGMAILPGRLVEEIELIKDVLLKNKSLNDYRQLDKHADWIKEMMSKSLPDNLDEYIKMEIGRIFEQMLEDVNVFKYGDQKDFISFVEKAI